MPRGRHRHSPPLHRLLPPSAIAGVALVCALGPWVFAAPMVLRSLAAAGAATAALGAFVMRRWDVQAGKQVADLTRARAGDEWRFEERVAELETDLEESRELRGRLEQKLRAKRAELAGLRNEHASLLRRYATAETERATALEGRRLLEIEASTDARALPPGTDDRTGRPAAVDEDVPPARDEEVADPQAAAPTPAHEGTTASGGTADAGSDIDAGAGTPGPREARAEEAEESPRTSPVFSPEGSQLFLRAGAALSRLDADAETETEAHRDAEAPEDAKTRSDADVRADTGGDGSQGAAPDADGSRDAAPDPDGDEAPGTDGTATAGPDTARPAGASAPARDGGPAAHVTDARSIADAGRTAPTRSASADPAAAPEGTVPAGPTDGGPGTGAAPVQEDEAEGKSTAAGAHEHAVAATTPSAAAQPSGHFTVPTAVAVVPAAPARRPVVEGGFDFFGTQKGGAATELEAVQNEDLADVVGQEALALHKAEAESRYKPAAATAREAGQVIDLTEHDETEQIDVQGLRSAAS
ncbi:hypothetical protein [Streptomyces tropicalis]|uniref:Secreted protein n=1 Tax=Streptomyces tropicalis TaxID=3034234 RepID=A0ABT6A7J3_9ACTN|nr:hypothetical protein [Streptomyces tropicalis]MDF3300612.1 hypothetical protein [Streptomyces tropicalis]